MTELRHAAHAAATDAVAIFNRKLNGCEASKNRTPKRKNRSPQKKRPVRGDNRTGRAIWALGVDGRSRLI
nr:hypothetical protein BDOA9_0132620 [Bradyrhizobium sp. DOA9]